MSELQDIPEEDLMQIPAVNLSTLRQLSTAVRTLPEVIKAAKTSTSAELIQKIQKEHPLQHLEGRHPLRWMASADQAKTIRGAILKAMERGAQNEVEALCDISINYEADLLIEENLKEAER